MATLTAKARQLIERGIEEVGDVHHRKVWYSWTQANRDVRGPGGAIEKLPVEVLATAFYALEHVARCKRRRLEERGISEDDVADIDNDLSYIRAVERSLAQSLPERV